VFTLAVAFPLRSGHVEPVFMMGVFLKCRYPRGIRDQPQELASAGLAVPLFPARGAQRLKSRSTVIIFTYRLPASTS